MKVDRIDHIEPSRSIKSNTIFNEPNMENVDSWYVDDG